MIMTNDDEHDQVDHDGDQDDDDDGALDSHSHAPDHMNHDVPDYGDHHHGEAL